MKSIQCSVVQGIAAAMLFLTTGCQSVVTTHTQAIGAPKVAAVDPAQVQILREKPTRPYDQLGRVRAETSNPSVDVTKIEDALRKEGAKLGADAVVVVSDSTQVTGEQVEGGLLARQIEDIEGRVVVATAIKYK